MLGTASTSWCLEIVPSSSTRLTGRHRSSPTIAVLWRPLAALPGELGVLVWWLAAFGALLAALSLLWRRRPLHTSVALLALAMPTAGQIAAANVNEMILLGLVLMWIAWVEGRARWSGAISALLSPGPTPGPSNW